MNKIISKNIFIRNKILKTKYFSLEKKEMKKYFKNKNYKKVTKFPIVVKPISEGSSLGVKICKIFRII